MDNSGKPDFGARMRFKKPRVAVRALILVKDQLLLVNAYPGNQSDLWCAPGGGVENGQSLPENLAREVYEETGIKIGVGDPALVNEFHNPDDGFHQIDIYFRAEALNEMPEIWEDPEGIVTERRLFTRSELSSIRYKPDSLINAAWGEALRYDPLELIVR